MSTLERTERQEEEQRVKRVVKEIDQQIGHLEEQTADARGEMVEIRKNFWEDVTVNFEDAAEMAETAASMRQQAEVLFDREHTHRHAAKQLKTMYKLRQSPYFGRIDFAESSANGAEAAPPEPIYLGIASMRDESDDSYLIYDWRAPVSSLYYDYPPGPAQYETPMGTIEGELMLKRQFVIRDAQIVSLFDTGVTIGDELLQEVLGRQSDAQMKSIVATIQREQNLIIRNERTRLLIVQGAAGSGKTSAALQRVAYLLYRYRGSLTADQIVLFSPNPMFNSYVSTVLPELGEENMEQTTFQDYLRYRLEKSFRLENPYDQLEYALSAMDEPDYAARMAAIRYKASYAFVQLMERYITVLAAGRMHFRAIVFRGRPIATAEEIATLFYSLDPAISIANRLRLVSAQLLERLKSFEQTVVEEPWVDDEIELLDKETYLKAFQTLRRKKHFSVQSFDDFEAEKRILAQYVIREHLKPLRKRIKKLGFINMKAIYQQLFADDALAAQLAADLPEDVHVPAEWPAICAYTLERLQKRELPYEDATPFLYMVERIKGFQTNTMVRYILLDEAQDYTAFQFAFIKRLFPRAKITALGDLNQSINAHTTEQSSGFAALAALYEAEETETIRLQRSYRSTRPIVEFTSAMIPGGEEIIPFNRDGQQPVCCLLQDRTELLPRISVLLSRLQAEGHRTIAVICKTAAESKQVHAELETKHAIRLIKQETSDFEKGLVVIPSYLSKGVEFDAVVVYDASAASYGQESERRLLYTVCTRAMHELYLFAVQNWSPLLPQPIAAQ